ncbi:MAG: ABC-2 family transporter protein [Patescibacteria group bacterium]
MYKGFYYVYIVAKNTVEQKKKVVFQMMNHLIFLLFSIYLYKYVYELLPSLQSKLPFPNAVWSMSVYFMAFWLGIRGIHGNFRADIRSGNIEMYLLRPIGYIWQKVLIRVGQGLIPFISAAAVSIIVCYFIVGLPMIDAPFVFWIFGVLLILILSQILTCLLFILCGLSGFWLEDSEPTYFLLSKLIMIFGGAWVPVAFFPKALQLFAEFSPFGGAMAGSFAMYPNFLERFPLLILNVVFWIAVSLILVHVVSKRAFKKLSVNG